MNYIKASDADANDFFGEQRRAVGRRLNVLAVGAGGEASNATGINGNQDNDSAEPGGRSLPCTDPCVGH
ncbi:MAG: hypothetical protein U5K33_08735 [Halofilum sp. (in: g-proteobacteria)]|nr:hypothetical protein [Halofilum sp. (in: g-proteobacteria)]